jgi:hypothetical protein
MGKGKKDTRKVRWGGRDTAGWGHLTESAQPKAWPHPAVFLTGPSMSHSGGFFLFSEGSNLELLQAKGYVLSKHA